MTQSDRFPEDRLEEALTDAPVQSTWSDRPSMGVVNAVATATGIDPIELPPLHDYVATEAIDTLLTHSTTSDHTVCVSFRYDGLEVTVDGAGGIEIRSAAE
ncbi:HalOD1 output domain-containing protein [Natrialbaceae archaeon A-gly3]